MRARVGTLVGLMAVTARAAADSGLNHQGRAPSANDTLAIREAQLAPFIVDVDPLEKRDWLDIDVSLMIKRDDLSHLAAPYHATDLSARREVVDLQLDERGHILLPEHLRTGRSHSRRTLTPRAHKKRKGHRKSHKKTTNAVVKTVNHALSTVGGSFSAVITWYSGHDLLGPSCVTHSRWAPTDSSMIAALTIKWPGKPKCGAYLQLRPKNGKKAIIVRVIDTCAGCRGKHVDLSKAAFSALYGLNIGLVSGIQVSVLKNDPNGSKYSPAAIRRYGPKVL